MRIIIDGNGRIDRQADEVETGAGAQAAYRAPAQPAALPGFTGFHGEPPVAFGFAGIGPGIQTGVVVAFELRGVGAAEGFGAGNVEADALFGLVVVADRTKQVAGQPAVLAEGEDSILLFLRVGPVVTQAQTAVGGLGKNVFRKALAVGE